MEGAAVGVSGRGVGWEEEEEGELSALRLTLPSCAQLAMCSPSSSTLRLTIGLECCEQTGTQQSEYSSTNSDWCMG